MGRSVHVWTLRTSVERSIEEAFERLLAPEELGRATLFRIRRARESFVVTHGALRLVLGRYLGVLPGSVIIEHGANGKPALAPGNRLRFNLTHSGDRAALALAMDCEVGIDLEEVRPLPDLEQIAERFLCPEDAAEILSLGPGDRERAFFTCWTRKEAYVKATGAGLRVPLNSFRVMARPESPGVLAIADPEATSAQSWTLHDLSLAPDVACAIAYDDSPRAISVIPIDDLAQQLDTPDPETPAPEI